MGCYWNEPGNYDEGTFDSCHADDVVLPMGECGYCFFSPKVSSLWTCSESTAKIKLNKLVCTSRFTARWNNLYLAPRWTLSKLNDSTWSFANEQVNRNQSDTPRTSAPEIFALCWDQDSWWEVLSWVQSYYRFDGILIILVDFWDR